MKNIFYSLVKKEISEEVQKKKQRILLLISGGIVGIVLLCQLVPVVRKDVQFLYKEDALSIQWAAEHKSDAIVFMYNPNNTWMIWDESEELMQYEKIYFASLADESGITDEELLSADEIYVYVARTKTAEKLMDTLIEDNPNLEKKEKIRELLYFDLYCLN